MVTAITPIQMATPEEIAQAEAELEQKVAAVREGSEAAQVSRLYWWTVEYGLIGDLARPQIYGAGLLSSVGESISCMREDVQKLPFSLDACIETDYDITKPQPQLFVCKDFDQLIEAVREFAKTMAFSVGGTQSLRKALQMGQTSTSVYSSGLQVSGVLSELEYDAAGEAVYLKTTGPTALAVANKELSGHGKQYHQEGFGSPIGLLADEATPLEDFSDERLAEKGIIPGERATLRFASGVEVAGIVSYIRREQGKVVLIGFAECTVRCGDKTLFQAEWGTYDMAVGEKIVSVFAGAADREAYETGTHQPSNIQRRPPVYTEREKRQHQLYQQVRDIRESEWAEAESERALLQVLAALEQDYPADWLLRLEILEILAKRGILADVQADIRQQLQRIGEADETVRSLIENGLALVAV